MTSQYLQKLQTLTVDEIKELSSNANFQVRGSYTKQELIDLITFVAGAHNLKKLSGPFHAWIVDKKTGAIIDDYLNPNTKCGKLFGMVQKINCMPEVEYEEFEQKPKWLEQLYSQTMEAYNKYPFYKKYVDEEDFDSVGSCLHRAIQKHKTSKKRFKIKFGFVFIKNTRTGQRMNVEGEDNNDSEFIQNHINGCRSEFMKGKIDKKTLKQLITFFARVDAEIIDNLVGMWARERSERRASRRRR